ncbi:MAG: tetratricopeptide repeat protein, partial [bacterium]
MRCLVAIASFAALTLIPFVSGGQDPVGVFFSPIDSDSLTEGNYILVFRNYEKASRLNLADADTKIDLARLYVVTREYEKAIIELEAARNLIADKKALSELESVTAKLYLRLGAYDKSLEHLAGGGLSDLLAGYCYEKLGEWESALERYNAAQHPGGELDDHVSYRRAYCLYELGRYEEALAAFERFKDEFPLSVYLSFAEDMVPAC